MPQEYEIGEGATVGGQSLGDLFGRLDAVEDYLRQQDAAARKRAQQMAEMAADLQPVEGTAIGLEEAELEGPDGEVKTLAQHLAALYERLETQSRNAEAAQQRISELESGQREAQQQAQEARQQAEAAARQAEEAVQRAEQAEKRAEAAEKRAEQAEPQAEAAERAASAAADGETKPAGKATANAPKGEKGKQNERS